METKVPKNRCLIYAKFKSHYVVWKHEIYYAKAESIIGLNRTMQYGNYQGDLRERPEILV